MLDITTYEGYGTTECAPLIAANHLDGRKSGTVGRPLQAVKIVAEDGSEIGYNDPAQDECRPSGDQGRGVVDQRPPMSCAGICTTPSRPSRC